MTDMTETLNRMGLQSKEFDALEQLTQAWDSLSRTPIVDDDYPEVRHVFESALASYMEAMKANGRFEARNRYGLFSVSSGLGAVLTAAKALVSRLEGRGAEQFLGESFTDLRDAVAKVTEA